MKTRATEKWSLLVPLVLNDATLTSGLMTILEDVFAFGNCWIRQRLPI
jgi:hypothetical protein